MAFLPMMMGGGTMEETVLWTNLSPTSSFAGQTVTISDDMNNYDYIAVKYAYSTAEINNVATCMFSVKDFKNGVQTTSYTRDMMLLGIINASNQPFGRGVYYSSDTAVNFGGCYRLNNATTANNNAIPLYVFGIKDGSVGTESMNLIYSDYKNAGTTNTTYTYTFTDDVNHAYIFLGARNISLTISGTSVALYTSSNTSTYEVKDVKAGDKVEYTTLTIGTAYRAVISIVGD